MSLTTSRADGGKFSGDVFVQLYGNYSSEWIKVPCEGSSYTSSTPAKVTVKLSDIGTPYRVDVRVEKPGGGGQSGLKLDRIEVVCSAIGDNWVYPSSDTVTPDSQAYVSRKDMLNHGAQIFTKDADFDGAVFVTLVCDGGETDEVQLLDSDGNSPLWTASDSVWVTLRTFDLGKVQTIKVSRHGNPTSYEREDAPPV